MCGIVGYIGSRNAYEILIKGLHRLKHPWFLHIITYIYNLHFFTYLFCDLFSTFAGYERYLFMFRHFSTGLLQDGLNTLSNITLASAAPPAPKGRSLLSLPFFFFFKCSGKNHICKQIENAAGKKAYAQHNQENLQR